MIGNLSAAIFTPGAVLGDYESIATVTLTSSNSVVEFLSIPTTYQHLQIRGISRSNRASPQTVDYFAIQLGSDFTSSYSRHYLTGNGSSASAGSTTSTTQIDGVSIPAAGATASIFDGAIIDILDYKDTNKYKTVRMLAGNDRNGAGDVSLVSGLWMKTNAVSAVKITCMLSTFVSGTTFALYGIKG